MTKERKWSDAFSDSLGTFKDSNLGDVECARIEFDDEETTCIPVLHYVHREDVKKSSQSSSSSDLSRLDEACRLKKKKRKSSEKYKERKLEESDDQTNSAHITFIVPTVYSRSNVSGDKVPTVPEHVPVHPEPVAAIHYPEDYTDNMFLEAMLTYFAPAHVGEPPADLQVEKHDEAVQTIETIYEENESENKSEQNSFTDVRPAVATVENNADKGHGGQEKSSSTKIEADENITDKVKDNQEVDNSVKEGSAHAKEDTEGQAGLILNKVTQRHSLFMSMTSLGMSSTCSDGHNLMKETAKYTDSERSQSDFTHHIENSRAQTPEHKFRVAKSKTAPIDVNGKFCKCSTRNFYC